MSLPAKNRQTNVKLVAANASGSAQDRLPVARARIVLLNDTRVFDTATSFLSNAKIFSNPKFLSYFARPVINRTRPLKALT